MEIRDEHPMLLHEFQDKPRILDPEPHGTAFVQECSMLLDSAG